MKPFMWQKNAYIELAAAVPAVVKICIGLSLLWKEIVEHIFTPPNPENRIDDLWLQDHRLLPDKLST